MIDHDTAKRLFLEDIGPEFRRSHPDDDVVILDEITINKDYGWIIFYQSRKFIEGPVDHQMLGNGPVIVLKENGSRIFCGTAHPEQYHIDRFEAGLPVNE